MKGNMPSIFVQLAFGYGAVNWGSRYERGEILGINERLAYGYYRAGDMGCHVVYSEDAHEGMVSKLSRLAVRAIAGFDLIHAWRNRNALRQADVVWTHTESQSLAVSALIGLLGIVPRPKLILQSVWLIDRWQSQGPLRRWLWRRLLTKADVLTFHTSVNRNIATDLFNGRRCEVVLFGIRASEKRPIRHGPVGRPARLIAVGNDVHRDWQTLIAAVAGLPETDLRIVSRRVPPALTNGVGNVTICRPRTNEELMAIYDWADIAVVPLKPNLHASGSTALQEAVLNGLPVICSDAGGLRDYFSEDEVAYVPTGQPDALRQCIAALINDDERRMSMANMAQARMGPDGLSSEAYVRRHVELSREVLEA